MPVAENIVGAELRIYQNANFSNKHASQQFTVSAFQLIRSDGGWVNFEFDWSAINHFFLLLKLIWETKSKIVRFCKAAVKTAINVFVVFITFR